MSNWRPLLERARALLKPDGRMFIHVFAHRTAPYRFDHNDPADWIARHFFTGGIMPSHDLIRQFGDLFAVEEEWRWNGDNYARTAAAWLNNMDARPGEVEKILRGVYGTDWRLWRRRWRLFFLATMGLFGHGDGTEWSVSHYRLKPS
jgi:cyclopropane-fatty-acyl-phospholipid synthase